MHSWRYKRETWPRHANNIRRPCWIASEKDPGYGPLRGQAYYGDASRRLRVTETRIDPDDPNRAYVTAAVDNYSTGGLFNSGSTYTSERVIEVVRDDGTWKINVEEYFY